MGIFTCGCVKQFDTLRVYCENAKKDGFTSVLVPLKMNRANCCINLNWNPQGYGSHERYHDHSRNCSDCEGCRFGMYGCTSALKDPLVPWVMKDVSYRLRMTAMCG